MWWFKTAVLSSAKVSWLPSFTAWWGLLQAFCSLTCALQNTSQKRVNPVSWSVASSSTVFRGFYLQGGLVSARAMNDRYWNHEEDLVFFINSSWRNLRLHFAQDWHNNCTMIRNVPWSTINCKTSLSTEISYQIRAILDLSLQPFVFPKSLSF